MILCSSECVPCCDFCIYVIREEIEEAGEIIQGEPIGCRKSTDEHHQEIAQWSGYCKDFHCFNVPLDKENSNPN